MENHTLSDPLNMLDHTTGGTGGAPATLSPLHNTTEGFALRDGAVGGTCWGELRVISCRLGRGSEGSMFFIGFFRDIPCAVKRLVRGHCTVAFDEITHMLRNERHPNIVRYWGLNYDEVFMFLAQEFCHCSLYDVIQALSAPSDGAIYRGDPPPVCIGHVRACMKGVNLWIGRHPSPFLRNLMREVVLGLSHLHDVIIVHRDLKPQNILLSGNPLVAKLSDVGIIKCPQSSVYRVPICGTSGWQAPELLRHDGCVSPAIDMFSLGCVLFFCITRGGHPFGERRERDANIEDNKMDLSLVEFIPEAHDLISRLLIADPKLRPQASKVLDHPFFWSSKKRLSFLCAVSHRVELEAGAPNSRLLKELENTAPRVFGASWDDKIETRVMANLRRHGAYDGTCVRDLLRAVQYNFSHRKKAPQRVKEVLGSAAYGLNAYFAERYPALLMESYRVLGRFCKKEEGFQEYFRSHSFAKRGRLSEVSTKSRRLKTR